MTDRTTPNESHDRTDGERRDPRSNDTTQMTDDTTTRTEESNANRKDASIHAPEATPRPTGTAGTARSHAERGPRRSDRERSGFFRRMRDVDHSAPVDGPARTFERNNEGRPVKTDGGPRKAETPTQPGDDRPADEERVDAVGEDETNETDGEPSARRMSDVDHTSPVDGHVRVFDRGEQDAQ